jgi:hypothetical protein
MAMAKRTLRRRMRVWLATMALAVGVLTVAPGAVLHGGAADTTSAAKASGRASDGVLDSVLDGASDTDTAKKRSGIYLEGVETGGKDEPKRLIANMPQIEASGMGASMASMGFKKPKMTTKVSGEKSSLRVAPEATFLFVFGDGSQRRPEQMTPEDFMRGATGGDSSMSDLPPNTSSPKDFGLIELVAAEGQRTFTSGNGKQVKCAIEKVEPKVFRIRPAAPLPPGEYGFTWMQSGTASMIWDFGVDGPATK